MPLGGTLRYCIITNNVATVGTEGGGGVTVGSANGLVESCLIAGNQAQRYGGGGLDVRLGAVIRNCLIYGNWSFGWGDGNTQTGVGGIKMRGGTVESCTIVGNYSTCGTGAGGMATTAGSSTVRNSIVYFNQGLYGAADDIKSGFSSASYSNVVGVLVASVTGTTADPLFMENGVGVGSGYIPGDYRLQPESPARDNGILQDWMTPEAVDFAGNPRVVNDAVDIGAYEWLFPASTIIIVQ